MDRKDGAHVIKARVAPHAARPVDRKSPHRDDRARWGGERSISRQRCCSSDSWGTASATTATSVLGSPVTRPAAMAGVTTRLRGRARPAARAPLTTSAACSRPRRSSCPHRSAPQLGRRRWPPSSRGARWSTSRRASAFAPSVAPHLQRITPRCSSRIAPCWSDRSPRLPV